MRRKKLKEKGYFAPIPSDILTHNIEALEWVFENKGFYPGATYTTKLSQAILPFPDGLRVGPNPDSPLLHIQTLNGSRAVDLRRSSLDVLATFLTRHNIKLIPTTEDQKRCVKYHKEKAKQKEKHRTRKKALAYYYRQKAKRISEGEE